MVFPLCGPEPRVWGAILVRIDISLLLIFKLLNSDDFSNLAKDLQGRSDGINFNLARINKRFHLALGAPCNGFVTGGAGAAPLASAAFRSMG